jgi:tetratricopeptide (TPR) repeat protein
VAHADKKTSAKLYKQGKKKFNLGEFDEAIELFKKAYDEYEAPAYLYNIAQAYRQLDDCKKAIFFYERFLAEKPDSGQAETIRGYIAELEEICKEKQAAPSDAPSEGAGDAAVSEGASGSDPSASGDTAATTESNTEVAAVDDAAASGVSSASTEVHATTPSEPRGPLVALSAEAGAAFFSMGDVIVPVSATLRLGAAYPIELGELTVEPGVAVLLSTMAYEEAMGDSTVLFSTYLANASASYRMSDTLRVAGELGVGVFSYSGLAQGNPFTEGGMEQGESFRSVAVRVGASAEYALAMDGLSASVSPGYTYAGAHDGLADRIPSVSNLQLIGGVRYRW